MSDILPKARFLGKHLVDNKPISLALTSLTWSTLEANAFSVITHYNGHYVVQGHSRSPILVPIESPYIRIILTYILSRSVSRLLRIIGHIFAFDRGSLTHSVRVNP